MVPKVYCLTRKQLGSALVNPSTRIGIIGILKLDGVLEAWKNKVLVELCQLKSSWIQKYESDSDCIWQCCQYGHVDVLKMVYSFDQLKFKMCVNQGSFGNGGKTPLMVAVQRDHYEVVRFLIEEIGADEDIPDFALNRPVHVVVSDRIAKLLKYSGKINAAELNPIETALMNDQIEVVKVFLNNDQDNKKLLIAATKSKTDKSIKFLKDTLKIMDLNFLVKNSGNNLLMEAVENSHNGSYEVYKYLISSGGVEIDLNRVNNNNENILNIAERVGNKGILRNLKKRARL